MTTEENGRFHHQEVNYLGFLEAKLRDLRGLATMVYELVQNADDVRDESGQPATHQIRFDVRDDMLVIENDGVFRDVDFARLQQVASGGKRSEAGTIGAFGIGFIAVYHVTDRPEIVSNGRSWTIMPQQPAAKRILEQSVAKTDGTEFRLPWAFDANSPVRTRLRLEAVDSTQLDAMAAEIGEALQTAALFLQQLMVLEVRRNGVVVQQIEREFVTEKRLLLRLQGPDVPRQEMVYHLLHGQFDQQAAALRAQFPQIEAKRRTGITIALSATSLEPGRVFAGLPTETAVPLALQLNGDFYPTTDRKRIIWGSDYQASWNHAIIHCAARTLAEQLPHLPHDLGAQKLWHLLQQAHDVLPSDPFAPFWQMLESRLFKTPLVQLVDKRWVPPAQACIWPSRSEQNAVDLLEQLELPLAHGILQPYFQLLEEVGVARLQWQRLAAALTKTDLLPTWQMRDWHRLWDLLETLLLRTENKLVAEDGLMLLPIGLDEVGRPTQPRQLVRGDATTKRLFPKNNWLNEAVPPHSIVWRLVAHFDIAYAVDYLGQFDKEQLEADWYGQELDLQLLFRWFENQQMEILSNPPLRERLRRLPIGPAGGELHPLHHLMLPGGFRDPLRRAFTVDLTAVGERALFFLQDLGLKRLTFASYLRDQLPLILNQPAALRSDNMHELVHLLAERLGEFQDDAELQMQLSQLPLVATLDGHFRPATETYLTREVYELLGGGVYVAEPVESQAVRALHHWLGVAESARMFHIVERSAQLIAYLRQKSEQQASVNEMVYAYLNALADPMVWEKLYNEPIIHVGNGRYIYPRRAYWRPHPYGRFRHHLDAHLRAYANFFTFLGVREKPVVTDAVDVLLDIGGELSDQPLTSDDIEVVRACWQALDNAWAQQTIPRVDLERLTTHAVILDEQGILQKPLHLFFNDQPAIAAQFPVLEGKLLAPPPDSPVVFGIAGVRRVRQQSWLHLLEAPHGEDDDFLNQRLADRRSLLLRVAAVESNLAATKVLLQHLTFVRAQQLITQVSLEALGRVHHAEPEEKTAVFINGKFYVAYQATEEPPWTVIANELARLIRQKPPFTMMALGLKEVLSSQTAVAAQQTLDELGYPQLS